LADQLKRAGANGMAREIGLRVSGDDAGCVRN
jgi:hypothetical protein